jgi:wobble nucleotide-excising tRNase
MKSGYNPITIQITTVEKQLNVLNHIKFKDIETEKKNYIKLNKSSENLQTTVNGFSFFNSSEYNIDKILTEVKENLQKVTPVKNDDLYSKLDIINWLEAGKKLHEEHNSKIKCIFCKQDFDKEHFNVISEFIAGLKSEAEKNTLKSLKDLISKIDTLKIDVKTDFRDENKYNIDKFYTEDDIYKSPLEDAILYINNFDYEHYLNKLKDLLEIKKSKLGIDCLGEFKVEVDGEIKGSLEWFKEFEDKILKLKNNLELIEKAIGFNNSKIKDKSDLKNSIVCHYIKEKSLEYNWFEKKNSKINEINDEIKTLSTDYLNLEKDLNILKSSGEIVKLKDEINKYLKIYLRHDWFKLDIEDGHYVIKRKQLIDGKYKYITSNDEISEGEKTALSICYFIIWCKGKTLDNKDVKIAKSIVVFDDPISSMDSNNIFSAVNLITNEFKYIEIDKPAYLVILTHNMFAFHEFRKKLIKLKSSKNCKNCNKCEKCINKEENYTIKIISKTFSNDCLKINIKNANSTMTNYESEYHYYYKTVLDYYKKLTVESNDDIEFDYNIPNMLRKLTESFSSFKGYKEKDNLSKVLKGKNININDFNNYCSFTNLFSHNQNTYSQELLNQEINEESLKENISFFFDEIMSLDEEHKKRMDKLSN